MMFVKYLNNLRTGLMKNFMLNQLKHLLIIKVLKIINNNNNLSHNFKINKIAIKNIKIKDFLQILIMINI